MPNYEYRISDLEYVAAGAAVLSGGGGGSYADAISVLEQLGGSWSGSVLVRDYDGETNACVLAMMGSPDAGDALTLADIRNSIANSINALTQATGAPPGCVIPIEVGPINSLMPLIAATMSGSTLWVVNGDGAGRAVPELPQTTLGASADLAVSPCALANDADGGAVAIQSAILNAPTAATAETLAGGVVKAFGSFAGLAAWPSNASNAFALRGNYIPDTLAQTRSLGQYLVTASSAPATAEVAARISDITGRAAAVVLTNFYITQVTQTTSSASLDAGIIRFDNTIDPDASTETHYLYNLNESLILYSSLSCAPDIIAPDSICYYSEASGRGFTNSTDDLAAYFDAATGKSTGKPVSIIRVDAAPELCRAPGVLASFAGLLKQIGYAGALRA